ncbi:hypothetical protein L195_g022344, partial [Trifolium pratense]
RAGKRNCYVCLAFTRRMACWECYAAARYWYCSWLHLILYNGNILVSSEGWWKCNVDASFYGTSVQTGRGWGVVNDHGTFVAPGTNICNHHLARCVGEAMAI